jgi:hypothetical protein
VIFKGSRYQNVATYQIAVSGGRTVTVLKIRPIPAGFVHVATADDRLDLLSYQFYRNPEKFWLIADANTAMDPEALLQPGRQLLIPPDRT